MISKLHTTSILILLAEEEYFASDSLMMYLSYCKAKIIAKKQAGFFTFEQFVDGSQLHKRTARTHLHCLITQKKFIEKVEVNRYKIVPQCNIEGYDFGKYQYTLNVSDLEIMAYSWKNIADFRSLVFEALNSLNRKRRINIKKTKKKRLDLLRTFDDNVVATKENHYYTQWDPFLSLQYVQEARSRNKKVALSTIWKYRQRQN